MNKDFQVSAASHYLGFISWKPHSPMSQAEHKSNATRNLDHSYMRHEFQPRDKNSSETTTSMVGPISVLLLRRVFEISHPKGDLPGDIERGLFLSEPQPTFDKASRIQYSHRPLQYYRELLANQPDGSKIQETPKHQSNLSPCHRLVPVIPFSDPSPLHLPFSIIYTACSAAAV